MAKTVSEQWKACLMCVYCHVLPAKFPIYNCKSGHLICASCYGVLKHQATAGTIMYCRVCNSEVTDTRNMIAEELLIQLRNHQMQNDKNAPVAMVEDHNAAPSMHKRLEKTVESQSEAKDCEEDIVSASNSNFFADKESVSSKKVLKSPKSMLHLKYISRRPIRCPEPGCRRTIGVSSLTTHFQFEHKDIQQQLSEPNYPKHFLIESKLLRDVRCAILIGLLLVSGKKRPELNVSSVHVQSQLLYEDTRVAIVVMCAVLKIPVVPRLDLECIERPSSDDETDHFSDIGDRKIPKHTIVPKILRNANNTINCLIIWASGIEFDEKIAYSLEVLDIEELRQYTYHGPINSLRDSQDPVEVFNRGDCLIIEGGALLKLTSKWEKQFHLKVTIH